jgi:hypothetical protein
MIAYVSVKKMRIHVNPTKNVEMIQNAGKAENVENIHNVKKGEMEKMEKMEKTD